MGILRGESLACTLQLSILLFDLFRRSLAGREPDQAGMAHLVYTPISQIPALGIPKSLNAAILCSFTASRFERGPQGMVNSVEGTA